MGGGTASPGLRVLVRALAQDEAGRIQDGARWPAVELVHGESPAAAAIRAVADGGGGPVEVVRLVDARVKDGSAQLLHLDLLVRPASPGAPSASEQVQDDPAATRFRRVAAYAVIVEDEQLLLTQLSAATSAPGRWTLPGGGLDPGESPAQAVVREVHEETGHAVCELELVNVDSTHFVGRAPSGRLENFQGIGITYRARAELVLEPRVLDVGGSTCAAAWVPLTDLARLDLGRMARLRIARALGRGDLLDEP